MKLTAVWQTMWQETMQALALLHNRVSVLLETSVADRLPLWKLLQHI